MTSGTTPPLLASLSACADALAEAQPALARRRLARRDVALANGLPGTRLERWKYTNLRALGSRSFAAPDAGTLPEIDPLALADIPTPRLVIANGRYAAAHSNLDGLPEGLRVRLFSEVLRDAPDEAAAWLDDAADRPDEALQQWNGALATEGFVLEVDAGVQVARPLHLVVVGVEDGAERAFHLRHRIVVGERAALSVVKHHVGLGAHRHLLNTVLDVHLAADASLHQARVQRESIGATLVQRTQATLAARARYRRVDLELGAALSRHELNVSLDGDGAVLEANGVLMADGRRHVDTRLGIVHRGRDTRCDLVWRGFGADRGRAVFHGGILIAKGADGTAASLSNKNLLVSDSAEIDTQPVLIINADDVQAAHGATVGRLDEQALFYLRTRGLPRAEATSLLTAAFLREPLALLGDDALREPLEALLEARMTQEGVE